MAGTIAAATALALPATSAATVKQDVNFSDDDTLVQRIEKFNVLTGASYEVDVKFPEGGGRDNQRRREDLLGAQFPRLIYVPSHPFQFEWSVHLKLDGKQCSHDMSPFEFFHWTSATAWWFKVNHARANG